MEDTEKPFYCGIITVSATKDEEIQFVKAIHKPILSEELLRKVQILLTSRRKQKEAKFCRKFLFPLRGFTYCPFCGCRFTGSISQGKFSKYRYYHCSISRCKVRYRADILEALYEDQLKTIPLSPFVYRLFSLVLVDENICSARRQCLDEKKAVLTEISQFEELISKARIHLLTGKIDFEDFRCIKKVHNQKIHYLNDRLQHLEQKLIGYYSSDKNIWLDDEINIYQFYNAQDIVGKRYILSLFSPSSINVQMRDFNPLQINHTIKKIIIYNILVLDVKQANSQVYEKSNNRIVKSFSSRKVSVDKAIKILRQRGIRVYENESIIILDFLYRLASSFKKDDIKDT